jgi:hypothetical protein
MKRGEYRENRCWIVGDVAYVDLSTRTYPFEMALIDSTDIALVLDGQGRWRRSKSGYAWRWSGTTFVFLHRHLLGLSYRDGKSVDHANGDGLDNRRSNIRLATSSQNNANRRSRLSVDHRRGVSLRPSGRWQAQIRVDGAQRFLGNYGTEEEAARAYDAAALEVHGEFARVNFTSVAL